MISAPDGHTPCLANTIEQKHAPIWVVHRLDKETTGVNLFARSEIAHRLLCEQFENHLVQKTYHALVRGIPSWENQTVEAALVADADRHHRTIVSTKGKPAVTHFRVLQRFFGLKQSISLIEAKPVTGRTHQIRVHLQTIGYPIIADALYGYAQPLMLSELKRNIKINDENEPPLIGRVALHAQTLVCTHPTLAQIMQFTAPYPRDFKASLNQLSKL